MGPELTIEEAFRKWGDELLRYATVLVGADDANDVVAQAFADVLGSRRWSGVANHRGYLFATTLNAARALRRSQSRREAREWRTRPESTVHLELASDPDIIAAVNRLSVQQRSVIYLTYWEDLTPTAIAELTGVREGTVRRQLARARASLRKVLR
ncbi:MAG: sigma-70 family RNA polymerase sigma factor [Acidimicrobiales bacterium]|nr:sigma-70 family RNA polymerase sigma factor [Acidimicrobiales bacterium]